MCALVTGVQTCALPISRASWPATEAKAPSTVCATGRSATAFAGGWLWALMGPALSRSDGRRVELGTDAAGGGQRIVGGGDGAADDQIIGAGGDRLLRRHDALLVAGGRPARADTGHHQQELRAADPAQRRDLMRRADHAVEAAGLRQQGEALDLRSEERRVGKGGVRSCRSRGAPYH